MSNPPPGFVLDNQPAAPPPGFVLDAPPSATPKPVAAAMSVNNPPLVAPGPRTTEQPTPPKPWGDVATEAVQNLPSSAGNFVHSLVQPFVDPAGTVKAIYDIDAGVKSKIVSPAVNAGLQVVNAFAPQTAQRWAKDYRDFRGRTEQGADAAGQYFGNRYDGVENIKNAIATDPVGVLADVSTVASGGASLPGRAGTMAAKVAAMTDPVTQTGNAIKLAGKGAEAVTSNALGMTTGAGKESVRAAARAGAEGGENAKAFTDAMRGNTAIDDTVSTAKQAVDAVRKERSDAYRAGMADLSKDKTVMDFAPIDAAVDKASQVGSFKGVTVEPKAQGIVAEMRGTIEDWKKLDPAEYHTPEGIDALKRALGNIRDSAPHGTPERVAADRVYNAVRGELTKQAPDYAKTMEAYAQASDNLKEVTRTLSLGEKATGDTAGRKLLSATRNNAQTNYGQRINMIEALAEHEPTLPYAIAGHAMNSLAPQGVIGRGGLVGSVVANPMNAFAAPVFSPRIVGEGAYYAGKGAGLIDNALALLRINEQNARRGGQAAYQSGRQQEAR